MAEQEVHAPYFSIIIPTYNRAKLIQNTLKTVSSQSFKNFEVLIIDDCSTDNTIEAIQPFLKDPRFRLIKNPENYERAKSRNIGFKNAKGKFLTLLDSDDYIYPNNLLDAYEFSQAHPEYHFFRNLFELVDEKGKVVGIFSDPPKKNEEIKALSIGNFISCIGVFISETIYKNYYFDENRDFLVSEDWEIWLRVRADYELGTINKVNNGVLAHEDRSMLRFNPKELEYRKMLIIDKTLNSAHTKEVYKQYEKDMKVAAMLFVAIQANSAGRPNEAFRYLYKAFKIAPSKIFQMKTLVVLYNAIFK